MQFFIIPDIKAIASETVGLLVA